MMFRPPNSSDIFLLYSWRNDKITRKMSKNPRRIETKEHLTWFKSNRANLQIAEIDGKTVGVVGINANSGKVSINVAPEFRGKGYGKQMLITACQGQSSLFAIIHKDNLASQKIFEAAGFIQNNQEENEEWLRYLL